MSGRCRGRAPGHGGVAPTAWGGRAVRGPGLGKAGRHHRPPAGRPRAATRPRASTLEGLAGEGVAGVRVGPAGLEAAAALEAGATVLQVGSDGWIGLAAVRASPVGPAVAGLRPWVQLALYLLHERSRPASEWGAFLDRVGDGPAAPLLWARDDLLLLEGTQLAEQVGGYFGFVEGEWRALEEAGVLADPAVFDPDYFNLAGFKWAFATVRGHLHAPLDGGEETAIVPAAAWVAHSSRSGATLQVRKGLFGKEAQAVLKTDRPLAAGAPVAMNFGEGALDSQVLLDYGVWDPAPGAFRGGYNLALALPEDDPNYHDKLDILEQGEFPAAPSFALRQGENPPEELVAFMRLVQLRGMDAFLLEPIFRSEIWEHLYQPVSEENERHVCDVMIRGCNDVLARYGAGLDEDLLDLRRDKYEPGSPGQAALLVRIGEQAALEGAARFFQDRMGQLEGLLYYQQRRLRNLNLLDEDGNSTFDDADVYFPNI